MNEKSPVKRINNTKHVTADRNAYKRIRYQKMVQAGICPTCAKTKEDDGFTVCPRCRKNSNDFVVTKEKQLEYNQNYYQKRVKKGLCPKCGKKPPAPDRVLCQECLREAKSQEQIITKEKQFEYNQNYYQKKVKKGLCPKCGKKPPAPDRVHCRECLDKAKRKEKRLDVDFRKQL